MKRFFFTRHGMTFVFNRRLPLKQLFSLVFLTYFLTSCMSGGPISVREISLQPGRDIGFIVGSFTRSVDMYPANSNTYEIRFRRISDGKDFRISHTRAAINTLFGDEIQNKGNFGTLVARDLPPGEYEIYEYAYFVNDYISWRFIAPLRDKFRFNVESGQITYIGELKQTLVFQIKEDGRKQFSATILSVSDQANQDFPLLKKKFPELISTPIVINLAKGTSLSNFLEKHSLNAGFTIESDW